MKEQTTFIDTEHKKILNLDIDENGNFIAFTEGNTVLTNLLKLKIEITLETPIIRKLDDELFLLTDTRTAEEMNGYIFSFDGHLKTTFLAGDGIQDIVVQNKKIIITYFDEGVFGGNGPNNDGLSVFDFYGNQLWGFNSKVKDNFIDDCYCICKHETNKVLFYAYSSFNLYELNLDTLQVEVYKTPDDFIGSSSISSRNDNVYFHSSYHDKYSFFHWNRRSNEVLIMGYYNSELTGIKNGIFFTYGDNGFTTVDLTK